MKNLNLLKPLLLVILATMFISCECSKSEFDVQIEKRTREFFLLERDSVALLIFEYEQKILEIPKSDTDLFEKGDGILFKHDSLYAMVRYKKY